ncbi:50S ribosomal protein L19 [Candidatus Beckwithbacteria bacterium RIFCSPLOWO2_02_FULL_47_23]|uniref:50S ribosomal protein L19 n=1 Tax=Candidatus Beckwithbacteria bacterium RIFCSPLOWO2_02_FULL_47_23 TaxID=1797463 RepID=A0A1F5E258_9BACT|nr:MAG: 50S ribosomal protein L19 [Candidatus Beckwithbacteria bacterium RIFCSPLOWO2_02_FULL_47_23]
MAIQAKHQETGFQVGDTVRVKQQFQAGEKTQSQTFEGVVIAIKGRGIGKSFTVRKIGSDAVGVEKIWPLMSPNVLKVTVKKAGKVRRAKLYYLRQRIGKLALATKAS